MKLRTKIPVLLGTILFLMMGIMYLWIFQSVSTETRQVETNIMNTNIDRVLGAVSQEGDSLQVSAGDYAAWDDTYKFVADKNQQYIDTNLGSDSFANLHVDLVAVLNNNRELVYARHYDWDKSKELPVPADLEKTFQNHENIFASKVPQDKYTDFFTLDGQLYFLAARPIVTSNYQGPIMGTLIMMRIMDDDYVSNLSTLTKLNLSFAEIPASNNDEAVSKDANPVPLKDSVVTFTGDNSMDAVFAIKDDEGDVQAMMKIVKDRSVYQLALGTLHDLLLFFILFTVITMLGILAIVNRYVLRRVYDFSNAMTKYQTDPTLFSRVGSLGKDELTLLAATVQAGMKELDHSRIKIRNHAEKTELEKKKLDAILHGIGEGVFVIDIKGHVLLANRAAKKISGMAHDQFLHGKFFKYFKFLKEGQALDMSFLVPVFEKGLTVQTDHDVLFVPKKGEPIHVSVVASPVKKRFEVIGCVVVFKDMSREFEIDRMKTEFVSIASHQLHTPLTSIKWMISLLMKGPKAQKLSQAQTEYLNNINESNERMILLVDDLLNISRIESSKARMLQKTSCNVKELIEKVMNEQEGIAIQLGVRLEKKLAAAPCIVEGDSDKLYQVFMNLANNAIKYSKQGGSVEIGYTIADNVARFSVKDSGIGIPKDQQEKIFQKFFRADNAVKSRSMGTGLGLYYVKMVVEAHGGRVWFESEADKGTTFYFTLPLKG